MRHCRSRSATLFGFAVVCVTLAGCTGGGGQLPPAHANLQNLAKFYGMYQSQNKGKTPADEKTFKEFIRKSDPAAKVDEMFVSPRDNEPYVVRYNQKLGVPGQFAPIIAYEKAGSGGRHMVARSLGQVEEVDAAALKDQLK